LDKEQTTSKILSVYQSRMRTKNESELEESFTVISLILRGDDTEAKEELSADVYISGLLRVNFASHTVYYGRELVLLSDIEFRLLCHFCRHEDRVLTKAELLKAVWGKRSLSTRTLDVYVTRLRLKLRQAGLKDNRIKTLHGQGYILIPK
jgi:DNA-binding response OmpR family regulator